MNKIGEEGLAFITITVLSAMILLVAAMLHII